MIAIKNFSAVVLAAILLTKIHSYPQAQMIEKLGPSINWLGKSEIILIVLPHLKNKQ